MNSRPSPRGKSANDHQNTNNIIMTCRIVRCNPLALKVGQPLFKTTKRSFFWLTFNDPSDAFNCMYQYHLQAANVVDHLLHANNKHRADETEAEDQEQYLTHYEPKLCRNELLVCLKPTKTEPSSARSLLPA